MLLHNVSLRKSLARAKGWGLGLRQLHKDVGHGGRGGGALLGRILLQDTALITICFLYYYAGVATRGP